MLNPFSSSQHVSRQSRYDVSVFIGLLMILGLGAASLLLSGSALRFFDLAGMLIVFGGTFAASLIQFSLTEIHQSLRDAKQVFYKKNNPLPERARVLVALSRATKSSGLVVLDREAQNCRDPFLRLGLELAADRRPEQEIRRILELEQEATAERSLRSVDIIEAMAQYSPAMGLIGTLVGLVQLLGNLNNPSMVGPAMSVAFLTTLYGAVLSNLVLVPIAGKLSQSGQNEHLTKTLTIEGVISLSREENPVILEQRLKSFMPMWAQKVA
jgi:chemotaxis protein MotA